MCVDDAHRDICHARAVDTRHKVIQTIQRQQACFCVLGGAVGLQKGRTGVIHAVFSLLVAGEIVEQQARGAQGSLAANILQHVGKLVQRVDFKQQAADMVTRGHIAKCDHAIRHCHVVIRVRHVNESLDGLQGQRCLDKVGVRAVVHQVGCEVSVLYHSRLVLDARHAHLALAVCATCL